MLSQTTQEAGSIAATLAAQIAVRQVLRYASYAYDAHSATYCLAARHMQRLVAGAMCVQYAAPAWVAFAVIAQPALKDLMTQVWTKYREYVVHGGSNSFRRFSGTVTTMAAGTGCDLSAGAQRPVRRHMVALLGSSNLSEWRRLLRYLLISGAVFLLEVAVLSDWPIRAIDPRAAWGGAALCVYGVVVGTVWAHRIDQAHRGYQATSIGGRAWIMVSIAIPAVLALVYALSPIMVYKTPAAVLVLAWAPRVPSLFGEHGIRGDA